MGHLHMISRSCCSPEFGVLRAESRSARQVDTRSIGRIHTLNMITHPVVSVFRSLCIATLLVAAVATPTVILASTLGWNADALATSLAQAGKLPPPAPGVAALSFGELFKSPIGPVGFEFSDKARQLDGKLVRILGFMIHQDEAPKGVLMLAPFALSTNEAEYGHCDDLPPAVVFVTVPKSRDALVPFSPGPLVLTGHLELGARTEADGRVSHIRLLLSEEPAAQTSVAGPIEGAATPNLSSLHD